MIFGPIGSLAIGAVPDEVAAVVPPAPAGGGESMGGSLEWFEPQLPHRPRKKVEELSEAEMIAILLAADEEYWN